VIDLPNLLTGLALAALAAALVAVGLSIAILAVRRRPRGGTRPSADRPWGSDEDADRLRRIYFQKERRARAIRERERQARLAEMRRPEDPGTTGDGQAVPPPEAPAEWRYRTVLELEGEATPERVRLAYKRMIAAYHPDKVAGLGLKIRQLAEEETKAINEAYAFFRERYRF
jgi:hypothetical protein